MKSEQLSSEFDLTVDEHELAVDRAVTSAMYYIAHSLERGQISTLISGCRNGAIASILDAKLELAATFVFLGAELIATAGEGVVIEAAITNPSKAISLISSLGQGAKQ